MNHNKEWPQTTDINCFWCCHDFDNTPWGVPLKYEKDLFHMFGNFCSPNCVSSYIFDSNKNDDTKWELFSLLNLVYFKIYDKFKNIEPAPSKLCLSKFGGCLSIKEYRNNFNNNNMYELKFPPTISIIPVIEEININKLKIYDNKNDFIPVDKTRMMKANTEFKLKRTKPISNFKNTLDNCMNITIN